MSREYDAQLLESVDVRRRRLRQALLYGAERSRRGSDENVGRTVAGLVLAAVLCAGCVGWSFLDGQLLNTQTAAGQPGQRG